MRKEEGHPFLGPEPAQEVVGGFGILDAVFAGLVGKIDPPFDIDNAVLTQNGARDIDRALRLEDAAVGVIAQPMQRGFEDGAIEGAREA
ncbi:hypothetical protein D9M70_451840 [compost metagenome]